MATATPSGYNLYRLLELIDQGTIFVRKKFDERISNRPSEQFLAQEKKEKMLIEEQIITKDQYDALFPQSGNLPTYIDLYQAVSLLRDVNAFGLNHLKQNDTPQQEDMSPQADLRRLQILRNELAHISSTTGIDDEVFQQKWSNTEQILHRLNDSLLTPIPKLQQSIANLKNPDETDKWKVLQMQQELEELKKKLVEKLTQAPVLEEEGRPPKETCRFDGRLIKLKQEDIKDLDYKLCYIGGGAFGNVYKCDDTSGRFGIQIAVKKILFFDEYQNNLIRREMIMSRLLNPFILPLLSVVKVNLMSFRHSEYWIVSPFLENGDLYRAIENKQVPLIKKDRVKILLQLAIAIQYLHTKVPNVRGVILHKDISSKNVVLDPANNARLIAFRRERDDHTTDRSGHVGYCNPDLGRGKGATECWDYYSIGVIIREMLTGLSPFGCNNTFLKHMTPEVVLSNLESKIWSLNGVASQLNVIASQCLECKDWTVNEFKINVVEKIKEIWEGFNQSKLLDVQDTKCHLCMINPTAETTSMTGKHAAHCQQEIKACIACEKYSFLNPITCYCGTKLTPLGGRYGALLIAGNYEDKRLAEALTRDVTNLKNVLTSKAPCIIGISKNNVRMVTPNRHDNPSSKEQELLWPKVKENVKYFQEQQEIDTLLIHFSGHYGPSSFMLGSVSERISQAVFEELLNELDNVDRLIIFLDCCYAPKFNFTKKDRKVIQINACKEDEPATISNKGSYFTKKLIQCLKGKAERCGCSEDCQFLKKVFKESSDFITVHYLNEYLRAHKKCNGPEPTWSQHLHGDSSNIAYVTEEKVQIEFTDWANHTHLLVQLEAFRNMEQLQHKLCEAFGKETNCKVKVKKKNTDMKDNQYEDCDTKEKIIDAWVQRQQLTVKFESDIDISNKKA